MERVQSTEDLMNSISSMDRDNSVYQFYIPGKGKFTLVLQEEDQRSIEEDIEANTELLNMIDNSRNEYKQGKGMTTAELMKSLSAKDFK